MATGSLADSGEVGKGPRHGAADVRTLLRKIGPGLPGSPELQEAATALLTDGGEFSARNRPAWAPGLLGLVGADVLERHVGGGRDPIGAKVGLEDRGHEDRAILGTK